MIETEDHCITCTCNEPRDEKIEQAAKDEYMDLVKWVHVVETIKTRGDLHEYHKLIKKNPNIWGVECDECDGEEVTN